MQTLMKRIKKGQRTDPLKHRSVDIINGLLRGRSHVEGEEVTLQVLGVGL